MNDRQHYVFLQEGDVIQEGDEWFNGSEWLTSDIKGRHGYDTLSTVQYRRKVNTQPTAQPTEETCKWKRLSNPTASYTGVIENPHNKVRCSDMSVDCPTCGKRIEVVE